MLKCDDWQFNAIFSGGSKEKGRRSRKEEILILKNMRKFSVFGGYGDINGGMSYEWEKRITNLDPVVDIIGNGTGWAKETYGPVVIKADGIHTMIRVTGPGGWKIVGPETIS